MEKSPASSGIPQEDVDFPGVQLLGATSRQKPSYRHPRARVPMLSMVEYSCTVHCTAVQDSCTVTRHQYECDVIRHVIIGAARQNYKKNTRRKEEERPRTGTFFAPWGCMSVMEWPIFTGHYYEGLCKNLKKSGLRSRSLMYYMWYMYVM